MKRLFLPLALRGLMYSTQRPLLSRFPLRAVALLEPPCTSSGHAPFGPVWRFGRHCRQESALCISYIIHTTGIQDRWALSSIKTHISHIMRILDSFHQFQFCKDIHSHSIIVHTHNTHTHTHNSNNSCLLCVAINYLSPQMMPLQITTSAG